MIARDEHDNPCDVAARRLHAAYETRIEHRQQRAFERGQRGVGVRAARLQRRAIAPDGVMRQVRGEAIAEGAGGRARDVHLIARRRRKFFRPRCIERDERRILGGRGCGEPFAERAVDARILTPRAHPVDEFEQAVRLRARNGKCEQDALQQCGVRRGAAGMGERDRTDMHVRFPHGDAGRGHERRMRGATAGRRVPAVAQAVPERPVAQERPSADRLVDAAHRGGDARPGGAGVCSFAVCGERDRERVELLDGAYADSRGGERGTRGHSRLNLRHACIEQRSKHDDSNRDQA